MTSKIQHAFEEHTGAVRVRLEAPSLVQLFAEAGRALGVLVAPDRAVWGSELEEESVLVRAWDRDALLVEWLNDLVFRCQTTKRIYPQPIVDSVSEHEVRARIRGVDVRELQRPIKAATLHGVYIRERPDGGFAGAVVLDV